jgi:hypothetical protein
MKIFREELMGTGAVAILYRYFRCFVCLLIPVYSLMSRDPIEHQFEV